MSNIIRIGGGGDLDQIQFTQNGDYYAEDYNIDGFYRCIVNLPLDQINITESGTYNASDYNIAGFSRVIVSAGGGYSEELTIVFPSSFVGETWTCEATGTGAATESYTGTVDNTQLTVVNLTQATTEYTISCGGISATYTTGGVGSFNLGAAAKIISSMTNLKMTSNNYTDGNGITFVSTYSSSYSGNAYNAFDDNAATYWIVGDRGRRLNGYIMLNMSTPCKIKEFEISGDLEWRSFTYLVQGSNDGSTWDTIKTITTSGTGSTATATQTHELNPTQAYSYYRWIYTDFTGVSSDYLPRINEIKFTKVTA